MATEASTVSDHADAPPVSRSSRKLRIIDGWRWPGNLSVGVLIADMERIQSPEGAKITAAEPVA